jgi:hypothetical protein
VKHESGILQERTETFQGQRPWRTPYVSAQLSKYLSTSTNFRGQVVRNNDPAVLRLLTQLRESEETSEDWATHAFPSKAHAQFVVKNQICLYGAGFEVLTAVTMKMPSAGEVASCGV